MIGFAMGVQMRISQGLRDPVDSHQGRCLRRDAHTLHQAQRRVHLGLIALALDPSQLLHGLRHGHVVQGSGRNLPQSSSQRKASLNPKAIPGSTMEDVVTAKADYSELDHPDLATQIRLNSTAVEVKNTPDGKVATTYVRDGVAHKISSDKVVLACYNSAIPYLCPDMSETQKKHLAVPSVFSHTNTNYHCQ